MRRAVFRRTTQGMALFPFLAVLICTMGALIVLLVMILQQARVQAATASQEQDAAAQEKTAADRARRAEEMQSLRAQQEDMQWKREILAKQREQQLADLAKSRLELSHLEDHLRRLEDSAKQLTVQINELERTDETKSPDRAAAQAELEKLRAAIAKAKQEVDAAKKKAATGPRSFAIIPYQGPNGTRRRPIYVECAEEGIVIHPENIVLSPNDFNGPLGPGNPLSACLNATREYLVKYGDPSDGEPYPLLVVRPSGAVAYAMARAAMKSWEDEFGYELIDGDMKLTFPPADPELEKLLTRTIKDARSRQETLAAAMPSRYKDEGLGFVATGSRGFVATGIDEDDTSLGGSGVGNGGGGFGSGRGKGSAGGAGSFGSRGANSRDGVRDGSFARAPDGSGRNSRDGSSEKTNSGANDDAAGNSQTGAANNSGAANSANGSAGGAMGSSSSGQPADAQGGMSSTSATFGNSSNTRGSLARTKGADWALPNKTQHATGITRPIKIQCLTDRLVIVPERGDGRRPKVIPVNGSMRTATEACVSEIWKQMEGWGIAVSGGYWKPALKVEVGPGADARYQEFESLLQGSGLELQRK